MPRNVSVPCRLSILLTYLYFCGVSCNFSSFISNQLPKMLDNSGANNRLPRSIKGKAAHERPTEAF